MLVKKRENAQWIAESSAPSRASTRHQWKKGLRPTDVATCVRCGVQRIISRSKGFNTIPIASYQHPHDGRWSTDRPPCHPEFRQHSLFDAPPTEEKELQYAPRATSILNKNAIGIVVEKKKAVIETPVKKTETFRPTFEIVTLLTDDGRTKVTLEVYADMKWLGSEWTWHVFVHAEKGLSPAVQQWRWKGYASIMKIEEIMESMKRFVPCREGVYIVAKTEDGYLRALQGSQEGLWQLKEKGELR